MGEGEGETIGELSAALRDGPWPFQDELTTPWSWRANEPHPYPELPLAGATYFGSSSVILNNGYDFALELGGAISYKCPGSTPSQTLEKRLPGTVSPLKDGLLIPPHGTSWILLSCSSSQRSLDLQYRARAPEGAVPFKDAFTETGDGFNFFPFEQRSSDARSTSISPSDAPRRRQGRFSSQPPSGCKSARNE